MGDLVLFVAGHLRVGSVAAVAVDLAAKLSKGMEQIRGWRVQVLAGPGTQAAADAR